MATVGDKRRGDGDGGCERRRKRSSTERPVASVLSVETWGRLREMVVQAKSLAMITRITLAFFKEQELAQMRQRGLQRPLYPVMVPVSEVYSMMAPRKRRAYDVLHVLEGIGVLKRVHDKASMLTRFRGGTFLYFGRTGAIKRLESIAMQAYAIARTTTTDFPQATRVHIDAALLAVCNYQANSEHWPLLASTTVAFICFLVEPCNGKADLLGRISQRLVNARQAGDGENLTDNRDAVLHDINRRVYDIVNVLVSLNIVTLTSLASEIGKLDTNEPERRRFISVRNGVALHHAIFSNPSLIRIGNTCSTHLATTIQLQASQQSAIDEAYTKRITSSPSSSAAEDSSAPQLHHQELNDCDEEDLFPEIKVSRDCRSDLVDWWDAPLRDLLLRDALPLVDFLDWEIMKAISRSRRTVRAPTEHTGSISREEDLLCHEQLRPSC